MPTSFRIDLPLLDRLRACAPERAAFAAAFPDGIDIPEGSEPDPEIVERVVAANLNVAWMCIATLTPQAAVVYESIEIQAWEIEAFRGGDSGSYTRAVTKTAWRFLSDPKNIDPEFRS